MPHMTLGDYEALIEQAPVMVWRSGQEGRCDYFNTAWLEFTGRTIEQEIDNGWLAGVHPDDVKRYLRTYRDCFAQREAFAIEYRLRRADGIYRHVLVQAKPYTDPDGNFAGFIGSCIGIDERLVQERSSAADDFFEMSLDNVCVAGFDGNFKRVNPSWTRTLGWTSEELMSKPVLEFVHPDDRAAVLAARDRLKSGGDMGPLINRYRCKDGSYRWLEWRSVGHVSRGLVYAVARDITEQKRSEEQLRAAQERSEMLQRQLVFADRMASMGTLAAGVAHEINNPLAYVTTNLNMMLEIIRDSGAAAHQEDWKMVEDMALDAQEGAGRIHKIVEGLKTFSRAEEERLAVIDVVPLLEKSIDMTFNEIRHRARLVKEFGSIPLVKADNSRLGQVFINLLVNAAQAIPDHDTILHEIQVVTSTGANGQAVIEVRDTGIGIPASIIEHVFDPFFTTKPVGVGTGLGLYICHNIVAGLGGQIMIHSEEAFGTTVRVILPSATAAPQDHAPVAAAPAPVLPTERAQVLVVDDEHSIGRALYRILRDHEVTAVTTAMEALALLESGKEFHVILSDIMMPEMSGMVFYERLSQHFPHAAERVVFISGGAFTKGADSFLDRVPNEFLAKPFTSQAVRDIVQRYARRGKPSQTG